MLTTPFFSRISLLLLILVSNVYADESNHHKHGVESSAPTLKIEVFPAVLQHNQWQIKMTQIKNNQPMSLNDLKEVHTEKVHLLIIDSTLEDYSHVHPHELKEPGIYQFTWQPKKQGHYYVWADVVPLSTHKEEYVVTEIFLGNDTASHINRTVVMEKVVDHHRFKLSFEKDKLKVGQANIGKISITDTAGKPVRDLEPIMGAFAHIVGFSEDKDSIVHIHPMGPEPTQATDRGGPVLEFHIEPDKVGFVKLFVQVKINGQEIFVPFGIIVH